MIPLQRSGEHKEALIHTEPLELSWHTESITFEGRGHHHQRQKIQLTCNMTTMRAAISHRIILIREELQLLCRYSISFVPQCHSSSSSKKSGHPSCENCTEEMEREGLRIAHIEKKFVQTRYRKYFHFTHPRKACIILPWKIISTSSSTKHITTVT